MKNKFFILIFFISLIIAGNDAPQLEVRLNTSMSLFDKRDWIPYKNGEQIQISTFWEIMGDRNRSDNWKKIEKNIKLKPIFSMCLLLFIYPSQVWIESEEMLSNNFGKYPDYKRKYSWLYYSSMLGGGYSLIKAPWILRNKISFIKAKDLTDRYNAKNK